MKQIPVTINITIEDEEKFKQRIYEEYGEIDEENTKDFIDEHLVAHNTCDGLFLVEGRNGDTDGWIVQDVDFDDLIRDILDEEESEE